MGRRTFDAPYGSTPSLLINTEPVDSQIDPLAIEVLVQQIRKIFPGSGYDNVEVTILQAPQAYTDAYGSVGFKVGIADGKGPKSLSVNIRSLSDKRVGSYTIKMKRDGELTRIPPPDRVLRFPEQARRTQLPATGPALNPQRSHGFQGVDGPQRSRGPDVAGGSQAFNGPQAFNVSHGLGGSQDLYASQRPGDAQDGVRIPGTRPQQAPSAPVNRTNHPGFSEQQPAFRSANNGGVQGVRPQQPRMGSNGLGPNRLDPDPASLPGPASGLHQPPRPVPTSRLPPPNGVRRAPIPAGALTPKSIGRNQAGNSQSQTIRSQNQGAGRPLKTGQGQPSNGIRQPFVGQRQPPRGDRQPLLAQRQPINGPRQVPNGIRPPTDAARQPLKRQGQHPTGFRQAQAGRGLAPRPAAAISSKKAERENSGGGCCSGGGDYSPGPTSQFDKASTSKSGKKKAQEEFRQLEKDRKERRRKEEKRRKQEMKDRKKADQRMKKQKRGGYNGYEDDTAPMVEKSGFYPEPKSKKRLFFF